MRQNLTSAFNLPQTSIESSTVTVWCLTFSLEYFMILAMHFFCSCNISAIILIPQNQEPTETISHV